MYPLRKSSNRFNISEKNKVYYYKFLWEIRTYSRSRCLGNKTSGQFLLVLLKKSMSGICYLKPKQWTMSKYVFHKADMLGIYPNYDHVHFCYFVLLQKYKETTTRQTGRWVRERRMNMIILLVLVGLSMYAREQ